MQAVLDVLFPASCIGCNRTGAGLCAQCAPEQGVVCEGVAGLTFAALGAYEGILRRAILAVKDGRRDVAWSLGELMAVRIARAETLVPIPTTRRRRAQRGFDQGPLIARAYASVCGNGVLPVLRAAGDRAQHGRTRTERLAASARFVIEEPERVAGQTVMLIDDVITTGATVALAAAALRAAGAHVAGALAVARTLNGA